MSEIPFKFMALIAQANTVNANGRLYPLEILEKEVKRLREKVENRSMLGELGVPGKNEVNLAKTSHLITDLFVSGDKLMAEIEVLETPAGQKLKELISEGRIAFRMSGVGVLNSRTMISEITDYELTQIFACENPA